LIWQLVAMPVTGWCYRSFANSFTLCLIVSFVLQALVAVLCPFFLVKAGMQPGKLKAIDKRHGC
jgi:hypothetical protein